MKKVAVVTGGSSGLGLAFVNALVLQEYHVVVLARDSKKLNEVEARFGTDDVTCYPCDIANDTQLLETKAKILQRFQSIDWLISNAGIVETRLLQHYESPEQLKNVVNVNLSGTIATCHTFLPLLNQNARIVIISSGIGLFGIAGYSLYAAAKGGLVAFADALRRELKCRGISVSVACPCDIDTPQYQNELKHMPAWMNQGNRKTASSPDKIARIILKKAAKNQQVIITDMDGWSIQLANKWMPERLRNFVLDRIMPMPKTKDLVTAK